MILNDDSLTVRRIFPVGEQEPYSGNLIDDVLNPFGVLGVSGIARRFRRAEIVRGVDEVLKEFALLSFRCAFESIAVVGFGDSLDNFDAAKIAWNNAVSPYVGDREERCYRL